MSDAFYDIANDLPESARAALLEAVPSIAFAPERHSAVKDRLIARVRGQREGYRTVRAEEGEWRTTAPLVEQRTLADDGVMRTFLLRLAPGARRPAHSHAAEESSYVLEGAVRYGAVELRAGDYHVAAPGSVHEDVTSDTGALILLRSPVRSPSQP